MATPSIQNFYPDFVPNQILTNTQLNQMRTYLDQQNRLTRTHLVGRGIICGLTHRLEPAARKIHLSGGYGVTSEGYLIDIPDTTYLKYLNPYEDPKVEEDLNGDEVPEYEPWRIDGDPSGQIPLIELISQERFDQATEEEQALFKNIPNLGAWLEGKVLVLYLEFREQDLRSCLVTDCNNKGANQHLVVRALLVNKTDLDALPPCTRPRPTAIRRLHTALAGGMPAISDSGDLNTAYTAIVKDHRPDLIIAIEEDFAKSSRIMGLPSGTAGEIKERLALQFPEGGVFTQYHYDYLRDLTTACNEFVEHVCSIVQPCCPDSTFPRHLMVAGFGASDFSEQNGAIYRNAFEPSPVRNVMHSDLEKARKLFMRMRAMVFAFNESIANGGGASVTGIRVTPSHTEVHDLGKRAVPFYYDLTPELVETWQPALCCTIEDLMSYHLAKSTDVPVQVSKALGFSLLRNSFLRIEGHVGQNGDKINNDIAQLKRNHNLEFDHLPLYLQDTHEEEAALETDMQAKLDDVEKEFAELKQSLSEILANPSNWKDTQWEELLARLKKDAGHYLGRIRSLKGEVFALNDEWKAIRHRRQLHCGIDHLQADYLLIRGSLLCEYQKLYRHIDHLPSLIYGDTFGKVEDTTRTTLNRVTDIRNAQGKARSRAGASAKTSFTFNQSIRPELLLAQLPEVLTMAQPALGRIFAADATFSSRFTKSGVSYANMTVGDLNVAAGVQGTEPMYSLAHFGITMYLAMFGLRDNIHELMYYHLPKDLKDFNYPLFIRKYKDINRNLYELMILLVLIGFFLVFYLVVLLRNTEIKGNLLSSLAGVILFLQGILDLLNGGLKLINNCRRTEFAAVYYLYEYTRAHDLSLYANFSKRVNGLEHMAGVVPGGTFLTLHERKGKAGEVVVADFSLMGQVPCCCPVRPDDICLPPVAMANFTFLYVNRQNEEPTVKTFPVVGNDFDLNPSLDTYDPDFRPGFQVRVPAETEFGGKLSTEGGKIQVAYEPDNERLPMLGIDSFSYEITNECGETDRGRVFIFIISNFEIVPQPTGELRGFVRSVDGAAIVNATVSVENDPTIAPRQTNSDGGYSFPNIPANNYTVKAAKEGYKEQTKTIIVEAGKEALLDFELERSGPGVVVGTVTGRVTDVQGVPLMGAAVIQVGTSLGTLTNEEGEYFFPNVPVGTHQFQASYIGLDTSTRSVTVIANQTATLNFILGRSFIGGVTLPGSIVQPGGFTQLPPKIIDPNILFNAGLGNIGPFGVVVPGVSDVINGLSSGSSAMSQPQATLQVVNTLNHRFGQYSTAVAAVKANPDFGENNAVKAAAVFVDEEARNLEFGQLSKVFTRTNDKLIKAYSGATQAEQRELRGALDAVVHAYLDRAMLESPASLDATASRTLTKAMTRMEAAGISPVGIRNRWNKKELDDNLKIPAANEISKLLGG